MQDENEEAFWRRGSPTENTMDPEDQISERRFNSMSHYISMHNFIFKSQVMQILDTKAVVKKDWEKLKKVVNETIDQEKE